MARIRCKYLDCAFLDDGYCSAALVELDSDKGCLTYTPNAEAQTDDAIDDADTLEEWEDVEEAEGDDDDPWMDEEEDEEEDDYN